MISTWNRCRIDRNDQNGAKIGLSSQNHDKTHSQKRATRPTTTTTTTTTKSQFKHCNDRSTMIAAETEGRSSEGEGRVPHQSVEPYNEQQREAARVADDGDSIADGGSVSAPAGGPTGGNRGRSTGGGGGGNRRNPHADQAIMGAAEEGSFGVYDKAGELVKGFFIRFLLEW